MNITFTKLQEAHFPLLLKWLYAQHVREWWDKDTNWTPELITNKYTPYTQGFKVLGQIKNPMNAFVIEVDKIPIGYIQYYNKYDFPPEQGYSVEGLSESLAAIDFYIGEKKYLGKGVATQVLTDFLKTPVFKEFDACFVDPDTENRAAIRTYEKAGFKIIKEIQELAVTWMINKKC
jgi:aminoglycoside 6'-N-acetyltransferase